MPTQIFRVTCLNLNHSQGSCLTSTIHDKMLHPNQFFIPGFYAQPRILSLT